METVNIRTTPEIAVRPYVKGQTLTVENPDKPKLQLVIDQGEYFACIEDDIDKIQSDIKLMDEWTKDASERMKIAIDQKVLPAIITGVASTNAGNFAGAKSGDGVATGFDLGSNATPVTLTAANIVDYIVDMGTVLDEANTPESERFLVIPAALAGLIKKSELKDASIAGDSQSIARNGRIGMIDRFELFVSHNLLNDTSGGTGGINLIGGHKKGFTFASQMTEMETLRAQSTFGNIVRGLQVYGFKTVKPEALTTGVIRIG